MRITELFTAQSIALDEALTDQEQIISRLVELQATHGNITDKDAYKKALYAREAEGSTYVDNGITVPHAKTNVVTRPSLAALRLSSPVQYNAEDDGTTDLLFAIAAPENGSLHGHAGPYDADADERGLCRKAEGRKDPGRVP